MICIFTQSLTTQSLRWFMPQISVRSVYRIGFKVQNFTGVWNWQGQVSGHWIPIPLRPLWKVLQHHHVSPFICIFLFTHSLSLYIYMYICLPFTCNVVFSSYLQDELLYSTPSPKLRAQFLFGLNIPNFRIVNKFCSQPFTMFKISN